MLPKWAWSGSREQFLQYIVDLENFATASRRYTGDIHNWTVVDLFMTPLGQWKQLDRVMVDAHVYYTLYHLNPRR